MKYYVVCVEPFGSHTIQTAVPITFIYKTASHTISQSVEFILFFFFLPSFWFSQHSFVSPYTFLLLQVRDISQRKTKIKAKDRRSTKILNTLYRLVAQNIKTTKLKNHHYHSSCEYLYLSLCVYGSSESSVTFEKEMVDGHTRWH